jgi:T5SS/PEP-CTERM-associated repeat protein
MNKDGTAMGEGLKATPKAAGAERAEPAGEMQPFGEVTKDGETRCQGTTDIESTLWGIFVLAFITLFSCPASGFSQTTATWGGGTGNWLGSTSNWSCSSRRSSSCPPTGPGWDARIGTANDGTVNLNKPTTIGRLVLGDGAQGTLNVSGRDWLTGETITVGQTTSGTLNIGSHGEVNDINGIIGYLSGSLGTVSVTGKGSQWNNWGTLEVGNHGQGSLTISGGGQVRDTTGDVGNSKMGSGTVTVTGAGSKWYSSQSLNIGVYGAGTLDVANGGLVAATGERHHPGTITIGTHGAVNASGGTLQGNVVNDGILDPVNVTTIIGNYLQGSGGTTILDAAGGSIGNYGQLDITGNAILNGTLDIDFIDGFVPANGETFDFINVGGTGNFSGLNIVVNGIGGTYTDSFINGQWDFTANSDPPPDPAPEPGTQALLATALVGMAVFNGKKHSVPT